MKRKKLHREGRKKKQTEPSDGRRRLKAWEGFRVWGRNMERKAMEARMRGRR